jgi:hypothetical protein
MSKLARCALIFCLTVSFAATGAAQAPSADKPDAAAAVPSDFNQKIDDAAKIREQREQDIVKMIDVLRIDLLKLIEETKSGDEQRSAAQLQKTNDLQSLLSKQIDDNKTIAETRANGLAQSINDLKTSVDDLKKGISPWVAIFVSIGIAVVGFLVSWGISASNRGHVDTQRNEDIKRLQSEVKQTAAYALLDQWGSLHDDIADTRGLFAEPDHIDEKGYSLIVKIGNWYENFARRYKEGAVDPNLAKDLVEKAKEFLKELRGAQTALSARQTLIHSNFQTEVAGWQNLTAL